MTGPRLGIIDPRELAALLDTGAPVVLIDVREPEEWAIVRIDGAQLLPLGTIGSAISTLDPASDIVVYCHHGARSAAAGHVLVRAGFSRVRNLVGGIDAWSRDVDPDVPRYSIVARASAASALAALGALGVAVVAWRARHWRAMERLTLRHRRLGASGIVIGGEGFTLAGAPGRVPASEPASVPAVLLLHGAGDTPQTLRYLADALHDAGFHVEAPLLPGHGRTLAEFGRVTADQLTAAARASYSALRATHEWVAIIGLSMGGALAVQLAADNAQLPALGLIVPYLAMPRRVERAARLAWLWGLVVPAVSSGDGVSILDPEERARGLAYGVITPGALRALRETVRRGVRALPRVTAPTLVVSSRQDNRIAVADAERVYALLGAPEKRLEWTTTGGHVVTVDFGREGLIAAQVDWLRRHLPAAQQR